MPELTGARWRRRAGDTGDWSARVDGRYRRIPDTLGDAAPPQPTRRDFLTMVGAMTVLWRPAVGRSEPVGGDDQLRARPQQLTLDVSPGVHKLRLRNNGGGLLFVPRGYDRSRTQPMMLLLHGGGQDARSMAYSFPLANELGVIVVAVDSRDQTWDVLRGAFGPDVGHIDRTLQYVFARCNVDPARLAIAGFSDGASYALSLGLANGDLFSHIIAFSPGSIQGRTVRGRPRIFVSHGTADRVLPIDRSSHRIVPALQSAGYAVQYREFDGPHRAPPELIREALEWLRT